MEDSGGCLFWIIIIGLAVLFPKAVGTILGWVLGAVIHLLYYFMYVWLPAVGGA